MKIIISITVVWLLISSFCVCQAQLLSPKFRHLTTNQGLSQSHISAILKDKRGFMWFGSEDGLNKYDGYKFTHYKHDPGDPNSIIDSYVQDMLEDRAGNLWIATSNGLDRFDRDKNNFVHYTNESANYDIKDIFEDSKNRIWLGTNQGLFRFDPGKGLKKSFKQIGPKRFGKVNAYIYTITEDNVGNLWVGTEKGLFRFDVATGRAVGYYKDRDKKNSLNSDWIVALYKDRLGNIWVGTHGGGLSLYDAELDSFKNFLHDPKNRNSIAHNDILSIMEAGDGKLWIGTENGGISIYDAGADRFITYSQDANDNSTLSNNSVYSLYRDDAENIWIGTYAGGVNMLPKARENFVSYRHIANNPNSLSNNSVLAIKGDPEGDNIWIGTDGGGLNLFNRKTKTFTHFRHDVNNPNSPSNDYVIAIVRYSKDVLALGYHNGGFDFFNVKTGTYQHHMPKENDQNSLSISDINNMFKDKDGNLWLGTWKGGLNFYESRSGSITRYLTNPLDKQSISDDVVTTILQDKAGQIWAGTYNGLNLLSRDRKSFRRYQNDVRNKESLSHDKIQSILEDDDGNLWIGTVGGGLNYFDRKKQTFTAYTEKDGLASNVVFSILRDKSNNLWLSTNNGISRFDPRKKTFRNYGISDGLQGNEFRDNSSFQTADGQMFFGGVNGFSAFYPDKLTENTFIPPIFVTDFQIFNKQVSVGDESGTLTKDINETRTITLSYEQSVFTFEFAALSYTVPEKNQYAYMLEGFDDNWNYIGNKRTATYTNLNPDTYFFKVKGSNNDGVWNQIGTTIKVVITPPFWLTWWFKTGTVLLLIGCSIAFYRIRTYRIRVQKRILERQIKERTEQLEYSIEEEKKAVEKAELANRAKSSFLATMSHEIRTPMNGVIGLASLLAETPLNEEQQNFTRSIQACGEDLLAVINDILDFSKIESGNMELEKGDFSLRTCIEEVMDLFAAHAAELKLDLIYQIDQNVPAQIVGDSLRLRQILLNLVGNAIKFTKEGEVFLHVTLVRNLENRDIELGFNVKDTGIGIAEDKLDRLFKAFSQVDSSTTRQYGGSGLGLAICEKLVGMMGGTVSVESRVGKGSIFRFSILTQEGSKLVQKHDNYAMKGFGKYKILVVDDNETNCQILESQLKNWQFVPYVANSGKMALEVLSGNKGIKLVITDSDMPGMDGIRLGTVIRRTYPKLPVMLLSSGGNEILSKNPGLFFAVLPKPVKQDFLLKSILNELSKPDWGHGEEPDLHKRKLHTEFSELHPLSILVAEDNKVNQIFIMNALDKLGYSADLVMDGSEALKMAGRKTFDIIFMDIQMPVMDGLEATRRIKKIYPVQPYIIAMTANALQQDKERCLEAGMDDYISKPVKLEELVAILEKWSALLQTTTP